MPLFLWDKFLDFRCNLVHVLVTCFRVDRQCAEVNSDKRIGTVGSNQFKVFTSVPHFHDLRERNNDTLHIEQTQFAVCQHIPSNENVMLIPSLVVIPQSLFDDSLCLWVQRDSVMFPLVAHLLTLDSRLTYVLLVLIDILINGREIHLSAVTKAKEHQEVGYDHYARIDKRAVVFV